VRKGRYTGVYVPRDIAVLFGDGSGNGDRDGDGWRQRAVVQGHLLCDLLHGCSDTDTNEHSDEYPDGNADDDADEYADGFRHADADEYANQYSDGFWNADADEYANEHAHGDADQYSDEYTDEHGDADADQYSDEHARPADADANEYADAAPGLGIVRTRAPAGRNVPIMARLVKNSRPGSQA
jgi:hypothetical protein